MAIFPFVVVLSILFLYSLLYLIKPKKKAVLLVEGSKLPPSPPKLPIIGNLHQLAGKLPHQSISDLSQIYGPVMFLQLGNVPTLVISSSKMAKEVLKTHDVDFCNRPRSPGPKRLSYNFLDLAFIPYGDHWREICKVFATELFNSKRAQSLWHARKVEIDHLIKTLSLASPNPVCLEEKLFTLMDGIVGAVIFGKSHRGKQFNGQNLKDVLDEAVDMLSSFSAEDFFPSMGWIVDAITGRRARLKRCFRNLDDFFQMELDEHRDQARPKSDHEDLVDALVGCSTHK